MANTQCMQHSSSHNALTGGLNDQGFFQNFAPLGYTASSDGTQQAKAKSPFFTAGTLVNSNPELAMFLSAPQQQLPVPPRFTPEQHSAPGRQEHLHYFDVPPPLFPSELELSLLEPRSAPAAMNSPILNPFLFSSTAQTRPVSIPPLPVSPWERPGHNNTASHETNSNSPLPSPLHSQAHYDQPSTSALTHNTQSADRRISCADTATTPSHSSGPTPSRSQDDGSRPLLNTVREMLADLPPALQPVVLAKVSVRGRGGRQAAADPRAVDPSMDPRKARRILANRQSAAKSKLKTRVLLETLRVGKDMLVEEHGSVQQELKRLNQLVQDLTARNQQLEARLEASERERAQGLRSRMSHSAPLPVNWQPQQLQLTVPPPQQMLLSQGGESGVDGLEMPPGFWEDAAMDF